MSAPILSVGLPVYNGEKYLRACLDSLLSQDFKSFELIISDNGSTDGTLQICRDYARRDARIRLFHSDVNRGATWNFQRVVELAEGTYFKWAFYDDLCQPTLFRRCIDEFKRSDESVVLVYPRSSFIDEAGADFPAAESPKWDRVATGAATPQARLAHMIRRLLHGQAIFGVARLDVLRKTRPYGIVAYDWVKLAELAMLGKIVELPEILIQVRIHQTNSTLANKTWRELLAWHDPAFAKRAQLLPFDAAVVVEYLKSVSHLRLSVGRKTLCYGVVCTVGPWRILTSKIEKLTGPIRVRLQARTGWKWLSRAGAAPRSAEPGTREAP